MLLLTVTWLDQFSQNPVIGNQRIYQINKVPCIPVHNIGFSGVIGNSNTFYHGNVTQVDIEIPRIFACLGTKVSSATRWLVNGEGTWGYLGCWFTQGIFSSHQWTTLVYTQVYRWVTAGGNLLYYCFQSKAVRETEKEGKNVNLL